MVATDSKQGFVENRVDSRVQHNLSFLFTRFGNRQKYSGTVVNLSMGGMQFTTEIELQEEEDLVIALRLDGKQITISGDIVNVREDISSGFFEIHFRFSSFSDKSVFSKFLAELQL